MVFRETVPEFAIVENNLSNILFAILVKFQISLPECFETEVLFKPGILEQVDFQLITSLLIRFVLFYHLVDIKSLRL